MRVRDLRWHILACIILIFSYAGIAICFYLSISSGKVQDSMKILGLEAVEEVKNEIENKVDSYFDIFTSNKNDSLVYETGAESTEGKKFELKASGGSAPFRPFFKAGSFDRSVNCLSIGTLKDKTQIQETMIIIFTLLSQLMMSQYLRIRLKLTIQLVIF